MSARTHLAGLTLVTSLMVCIQARGAAPIGPVREIACAPRNPKVAGVLMGREIWFTKDRGKNWERVARLPLSEETNGAQPEHTGILSTREAESETDPQERTDDSGALHRVAWQGFHSSIPAAKRDEYESAEERSYLTVHDDGKFAVAVDGFLFIGDSFNGLRLRKRLSGIRGLQFDPGGGLWVCNRRGISFFLNQTSGIIETRSWLTGTALQPVLDLARNVLLVPTDEGLFSFSRGRDWRSAVPEATSHRIAALTAVAVGSDPTTPAYYVVSNGRLREIRKGAVVKDMGPTAPGTDRILLFGQGKQYVRGRGHVWFERAEGVFRRKQFRSVAIDADGELWLGTEAGPIPPGNFFTITEPTKFEEEAFAQIVLEAGVQLREDPGKPPCSSLRWSPLPAARFSLSYGRGTARYIDHDTINSRASAKTWLYMGVALIWTLDAIDVDECVQPRKRWIALREGRTRKLEALWSVWQKARLQQETKQNAFTLLMNHLEQERLVKLMRIARGLSLTKERP